MTAAIHLVRNPLRPLERDTYTVADGTQVIDWLQEVAPDGFGMPIELFVNQEPLAVIDSDRELRSGDVCHCVVTPGFSFFGAEIKLAQLLISTIVGAVVSAGLQLLFAPKRPRAQRGPNPVYDIGASNNQARLGEPIPVVYGGAITVPDFASVPYTFYSAAGDDQQYIDQLFCVGVGEFEEFTAADILIGDTPASLFQPGVILFRQFHQGPAVGSIASHGGQFGSIQSTLWETGDFGVNEFQFFEDVYTAPDVTDWEFRDDITNVQTTQSYAVDVALTGQTAAGRDEVRFRIQADSSLVAGSVFNVTGTSFDGQYQATRVEGDPASITGTPPNDEFGFVFLYCWAPVGVTPVAGAATITVTRNEVNSQAQTGYYACQPLGQTVRNIRMDLVAPNGLFKVSSSGVYLYLTGSDIPTIRFEALEIDPTTGNEIVGGFALTHIAQMTANVPDAKRNTTGFRDQDVTNIPAGLTAADWRDRAYIVRATATHTFQKENNYQQKILWTALKGAITWPTPRDAYGNTTLLAVRMRATNGISEQAQQQLRVRCRRKYTLLDGTVASSGNPVDVINDIYTAPEYGFGRPANEVDTAFLTQVRALWAAQNVEFNGVFLQDITGWEALETVLLVAVARPAIDAGQLTIIADKKKPVTMFLFNDMSIARNSYTATFTFNNNQESDGVEVEYRDPVTFDPAFARVPVLATNPERFEYVGVTNATYATQLAQLIFNRRRYQRHAGSFKTEMQGMVAGVGDKASIATPVLESGFSGRVVGMNGNVVILDQRIAWGTNVRIAFTQPDQSPTAYYAAIEGPEPNIAILATAVVETLDMSLSRTPTSYHIEMDEYAPRDMLITEVVHDGGTQFTIGVVSYPKDRADGANPLFEGGPPHLVLDWDGTPL